MISINVVASLVCILHIHHRIGKRSGANQNSDVVARKSIDGGRLHMMSLSINTSCCYVLLLHSPVSLSL